MASPATLPQPRTEPHSLGYTLGTIMLVVVMVGLASAYGLSALFARTHPAAKASAAADGPIVTPTLVGRQLHIPASWVRDGGEKQDGFSSQVAFELMLPLGRAGALAPIEVILLPLSQARPSSVLLDGVYLHQFMPNELAGPPGLVGKPLYGTEGYQNEIVWYDALSQNPFVAKCSASPDPQRPPRCLRTVALPDGIAAVYGFDLDVLYSWRAFDPALHDRLVQIGAL
jgi:hypothetical protein